MAELVYRDYDQEALDLQYDMRRRVPDHPEHFARLKESSDRAARELNCQLDVAFGDAPGEELDIFPAAQANAPIHLFIRGGYWRAFDKAEHRFVALPLVAAGSTTVLVNYDLCPNVTMNEIARQNRRRDPLGRRQRRQFRRRSAAAVHLRPVPIRLIRTPTTCRMLPLAGI